MKIFLILAFMLAAAGCGVKGDPVAPATPAEIGTGRPAYKGDTDEPAGYPTRPGPQQNPDDEEDEE